MKFKKRETFYAEKKFKVLKTCERCKRTILCEKMYIGHNGPYRFFFCTDCMSSEEEAKEASKIRRPCFQYKKC